jgi:hypothetical protein
MIFFNEASQKRNSFSHKMYELWVLPENKEALGALYLKLVLLHENLFYTEPLLLVMTIKRQFRFSQKYYCTPGN